MAKDRIYNFSAGPSMLPVEVLEQAAAEMTNYHGCGMSVMEMSHRSKMYQSIFDEVKEDVRRVMDIPDSHEILFMQGGATFQFSAVPLNLIGQTGSADYIVTGNFANLAMKEAKKYGDVNIVCSTEDCKYSRLPSPDELSWGRNPSYIYYCANNTIFGTEWKYIPEGPAPLVCDMSSNFMSEPVDVSKYGLIYGGVQKNLAPAGMALLIIDRKLAGHELPFTPVIMNYKTMIDKDSMYNTPPCYTIYMLGLVMKWIEKNGGLQGMKKLKEYRSRLLYDFLDDSSMFNGTVEKEARSGMNVTFRTGDPELDAEFIKEAAAAGFENLKGHRIVGGMRASIYNAMPVEGVEKLVAFMKEFEAKN